MKGVQLTRAVLKSSSAPLPFLLPAFTKPATLCTSRIQSSSVCGGQTSVRAFATSSPWRASTATAATETRAEEATSGTASSASEARAGAESSTQANGAGHTSPASRFTGNDVAQELANVYKDSRPRRVRSGGQMGAQGARSERSDQMALRQSRLAEQMNLAPNTKRAGGGDIDNIIDNKQLYSVPEPRLPKRLDAFVGRSQDVNSSLGLAAAMKMLEIKLKQNSVRSDFQRQRFHERPGLKRKRLKKQRWRKRFMEGFKATVAKVVRMKNMGW